MSRNKSCFSFFNLQLSPDNWVDLCKTQVCLYPQDDSIFCNVYAAYAMECTAAGVPLEWREATSCCKYLLIIIP